jgi:hypothetical protein
MPKNGWRERKIEIKPDGKCRKKTASKTGPFGHGLVVIFAADIPGR